jgi:hypothetical protein
MKVNDVITEVSLGDYRKKATMQRAQAGMSAMFGKSPEERAGALTTFNKRERGLERVKARDERARKAEQEQQLADLVARLPELKAEYARMRDEYKALGGSNWQYADREQNLSDSERKARAMGGQLNNLWRQIQAAEKAQSQQSVAEGSEFGAYYYEQLAQQTFDINPNLTDENEILNLGYNIAKGELGSRAQGMFRDEDFPSDFVSAYGYLKKQGLAEGNIGNAIKALCQKIYDAGDDEFEYFYNDSPIFSQYWDEYEGDLDSIIAEANPKELQIMHDELESYVQQANLAEDWQKVNKRDKTDGMSRKAVKAYRREHPGSKLKTAVTTKPSKLKKGSKSAKRRKSFCARMSGMKKAHASAKTKRDPDSPINKALRRWNCESIEDMRNLIEHAERVIAEEKVRLDPKCWAGKKIGNPKTKMKGGVRVNNCVPAESVNETGSPAQQAAIAISMKKKGQKPKNEN